MGSDWSLEELLNSRYRGYQAVCAAHDANYCAGTMKAELPPVLFEFKQYSEFRGPYYEVKCWNPSDSYYTQAGWLAFSTGNCWCYEPVSTDDDVLTADELREIADKIDELNTQLIKERTWLDRLFNM